MNLLSPQSPRRGRPSRRVAARRPSVESLEAKLLLSVTGPQPVFLTGPTPGQPLDIARGYLATHGAAYGVSAADLDRMTVTDQYTDAGNGVTHIYLRQGFNGVAVDNEKINVNVGKLGQVINVGGHFDAALGALPSASAPPDPALSAVEALKRAAAQLGLGSSDQIFAFASDGGAARAMSIDASAIAQRDVNARLRYYAGPAGSVALAWGMDVYTTDGDHWYDLNVDATTGQVLSLADWVDHYSETFNVFATPTRSPDDGPRQVVTNPYDPAASPFGWQDTNGVLGAESNLTQGNNAVAYEDRAGNNQVGHQADGGSSLNFDFPLDLTKDPSQYQDAAITNLYYWTNISHDFHYAYGFDEAAGNFQVNNYGNGGLGNDPVMAQAQDGSGTDNADMATPPDGQSPVTRMFLWDLTDPNRDGSLVPEIMLHEYGHGVSTRLTGGPADASSLNGLQSGGMGEGWSDFWSIAVLHHQGDGKNTARTEGPYALDQPLDGPGIRRHPYSYDMTINPATIADYNTDTSGPGQTPEVHNTGELWTSVLWDMYWNLVDKYGYDSDIVHGSGGNNLAFQLVMDGLKLQPSNPSFKDARDAILMADMVDTGGQNQAEIWQAFARRGMGASFVDTSADATSVTPAFDIPVLLITRAASLSDVVENQPLSNLVVATFTDPNGTSTRTDYTAEIDWGDGTKTAGVIASTGTNTFSVSGDHEYVEGGAFRMTIAVTKSQAAGGGASADTAIVNVGDLPISSAGVGALSLAEGEPFGGLIATFTDADTDTLMAGSYLATIDWGDGSPTDVGVVTAAAGHNAFDVRASHAFGASATKVTVTITGPGGGTSVATTSVAVADAPLVAAGAQAITPVEGVPFDAVVATFTDGDLRALPSTYYSAMIDWGDGTPGNPDVTTGEVAVNPQGGFQVRGQHTYKIGSYTVKVAIRDGDITTATATTTADVSNAAITTQSEEIRSVEGVAFTGVVASFIDANPDAIGTDYTATIDWGDGPTGAPDITEGRVSFEGDHLFVVIGSHAGSAGAHNVRVTIHEPAAPGSDFTIDSTNTTAAAPLKANGGEPVSGRVGVSQSIAIATFRSPDPFAAASNFSATATWGDNTSSDTAGGGLTIARNADGSFTISGTHTFLQVGGFPVQVVVNSKSGSVVSAGTAATIADAPITAVGATISSQEKGAFQGAVASFTSANPFAVAGQFTATVAWGDGTTSAGAVAPGPNGGFVVTGGHTYDEGGDYAIAVSIASGGGSTAEATGRAGVADMLFPMFGMLNPASDRGVSPSDGITNDRQPNFVGFSEPGATVQLFVQGVGTSLAVPVGGAVAGDNGFWSATTIPLPDGAYTVFASATDPQGRPSSAMTQVLPSATIGALVIDTVGPKVGAAVLNPASGQVQIALQDELSGLSPAALSNGSFYSLGLATSSGSRPLGLTGLSAASIGSARTALVSATFNGGRPLGRGRFVLTMTAAGLTDLAGNPLDERFFTPFPSLSGLPGSNYVAQFVSNGRSAAGPQLFVPPPEATAATQFGQRLGARGRRTRR